MSTRQQTRECETDRDRGTEGQRLLRIKMVLNLIEQELEMALSELVASLIVISENT